MQTEFRLPALGADMDAGTVVEWRVTPGDRCRRGDVVAVVETDKGAIDVEIFIDGIVRELLVPAGARVPVGTVLALLDTEAVVPDPDVHTEAVVATVESAPVPSVPPAGVGTGQRARISPAARKRALELHVDTTSLRGTGPEGAITVQDVERVGPSPQPSPAVAGDGAAGMRAAIAAAMSRSKREIPHYYLATTVDVTPASDWLAAHNTAVPVTERLLFAVLLVRAVALACRDHPGFSGFYRDGRFEQSPVVHVGVTEDVIAQAKASEAQAIITIEGFHSNHDISDVIYHVSMSTPLLGVLGWVLKIKIGDGALEFVREWPYFFDAKEKVKTLGEILAEMEGT